MPLNSVPTRFFGKVGEHARTRYAHNLSVAEHAHNIGTIAAGNTTMAAIWPPEELIFFARNAYDTDPAWYEGVSADKFALSTEAVDVLPSQVQCPVHLLYGDASAGSLVGPDDIAALKAAGMNITSTHIPGAAHTITPWHCREVLADLKAFLGSIPY